MEKRKGIEKWTGKGEGVVILNRRIGGGLIKLDDIEQRKWVTHGDLQVCFLDSFYYNF